MLFNDVALRTTLDTGPTDLVDVIRLAAVPRWFDIRLLRRLLPDKQSAIWRLLPSIAQLDFVEDGPVLNSWQYLPEARETILGLVPNGERLDADIIAYRYYDQQFKRFSFRQEEAFVYLAERLYHQFRVDEKSAYIGLDMFCYYYFKLHQIPKIPVLLRTVGDLCSPRTASLKRFYEASLLNRLGQGDFGEIKTIYKALLDSPDPDELLKIKVRIHLARLYTRRSDSLETIKAEVLRLYERAYEEAKESKENQLQAIVLQNRGNFYVEVEEKIDEAISELAQGLEHLKSLLGGNDSSQEVDTRPQQVQLLNLLAAHFNFGEIKVLSFYLGVDFEDLGGDGKTARITELIHYMERRSRLHELIQEAKNERPDADWNLIEPGPRLDALSSEVPKSGKRHGQARFAEILSDIYQIDLCSMSNDLAVAYLDKYKATKEPEYLRKVEENLYLVLEKAPKVRDDEGFAYAHASLAEAYTVAGDIHLALEHLSKACDVASKIGHGDLLKWIRKDGLNDIRAKTPSGTLLDVVKRFEECLHGFE